MNFASNLQKLRKEKNMSQEALAEKLDVTRQSVSKWESGVTYPEMDKLISICKIFNVDMDTLVNGDVSLKDEKHEKDVTINTKDMLGKFNMLMKKIVCLFESMSFKEIIGFLVTIFILILIILVGTIPKELIESLIGNGFLYDIGYIGPTLNNIFRLIVDILYSIFSIVIFIYVIKIKYLDRIKIKEESDKEIVEKVKEKRVEEVEKVIIKDSNNNHFTSFLAKIIIYIIKFFVVCFLVAPLICIVIFAVMLGFLVLFVFKGLPLVGVLLWTIAGLIITSLCFEVPLNFVINHKNNYKRVMISLLISLIIIIIGSIIFAYEFFSITYVDSLPKDVKTKEITEVIPMTSDFKTIGYYYNDIEYVRDDSLTDKVEVDVTYYDYLIENNIKIEVHNNNLLVYEDSPKELSFNKVLDRISDDIKNGKVYNYEKLTEYKVTVKTSSDNIEMIKSNNEKYLNENNS